MAAEGLAFRWLTVRGALIAQALWSCVLVVTGTYRDLFTRVIYTEWLFFALMAIGLMRLKRRVAPVPAIFATAALLVATVQIAADPVKSATGLGLVLAGLPVYLIWYAHPHDKSKS